MADFRKIELTQDQTSLTQVSPSQVRASPLQIPVELEPSPPQLLAGSPLLSPKPDSQLYLAIVPKACGAEEEEENVIIPLVGLVRSGQVIPTAIYKQYYINVTKDMYADLSTFTNGNYSCPNSS